MLEPIRHVRISVRRRLRSFGATAAAVCSIALGVCAVSVAFSALSATLLRPLPGTSGPLLRVLGAGPSGDMVLSFPEYDALREANAFEALVAERVNQTTVVVGRQPRSVGAAAVTPAYFETLGVRIQRGRSLAGSSPSSGSLAVVVSDAFASGALAGADALGRDISVGGRPATVVGVADADFTGAFPGFRTDLWFALEHVESVFPRDGSLDRLDDRFLNVLGTTSDAEPAALRARLDAVAAALADDPSFPSDRTFTVEPARGGHPSLRPLARAVFGGLLGLTSMVLLVVCANVTNLELARSVGLTTESSVRCALGASRARRAGAALLDGGLLGTAGAAVGLVGAAALTALVSRARLPLDVPVGVDLGVDLGTATFGLAVGVAAGIGSALPSALRAARVSGATALRRGGTGGTDRSLVWPQRLLVGAQLVVSTALLLAGAALVRGLAGLAGLDPGFDRDRIVTVETPATGAMGEAEGRAFWAVAEERAGSIPGVEGVAAGLFVHLGGRSDRMRLGLPGTEPGSWPLGAVQYSIVGEDYFDVLGIEVLAGRRFDGAATGEVIVNREAARRLWPDGVAVGRDVVIEAGTDGEARRARVVGVVETVRYRWLGEDPTPFLYLSLADWYRPDLVLHLRGEPRAEAEQVIAAARQRLTGLADAHPWIVRPMSAHTTVPAMLAELVRRVLLLLGTLGVVVSAVGVFGVVAHATERRSSELAVRMALGASPGRLDRNVALDSAVVVVPAVVIGLLIGRLLARGAGSVLPGLGGVEPFSYAAVGVAIVAVGLVAAWLPARRVTHRVRLREVLQR